MPGLPIPKRPWPIPLATLGEHEQAILVLDDLLRLERTNEQAAANREILARALDEMLARRLLGKTEQQVKTSALVQQGGLLRLADMAPRQGKATRDGEQSDGRGQTVIRYGSGLAELWALLGANGEVVRLVLVLVIPSGQPKSATRIFRVTRWWERAATRTCQLRNGNHADVFARSAGGPPDAGQ